MSIKKYIDELEQINIEIKRNFNRNKLLRKRSKELEKNIAEYLVSKNQPGIKYKDKAILLDNKPKIKRKTKKERENDAISYLKELGISTPKEVYLSLQNVQKGHPIDENTIKFKSIKK